MFRRTLETRWRAITVAAAILGLVVRLGFGLMYWVDKPLSNDELEYLTLARNLSTGQGFTYGDAVAHSGRIRGFGRAPVYPAFLSLISLATPFERDPRSTPVSVKIVQSVVGSATVVLIAILAAKVVGAAAGAVAAMIAAVYPPLIWMCAFALNETLSSFLALACAAMLVPRSEPHLRIRSALAAGAAAGLTALTRPVMLIFIALCTLWLSIRCRLSHAAVFVLAAAAVIAPWTIRNVRVFDRVVVIAPQGGVNFWIGNHRLAQGEGDLAANPSLKAAEVSLRERHPGLDEAEMERVYYREAFSHVAENPVRWLGLIARKAFYQWIPAGPSYTLHSARHRYASQASYLLLLPMAIAGLIATVRRGRMGDVLLVLGSSEVIAALIFFPQERYRIPVIDPILIIFSAAFWAHVRFDAFSRIYSRKILSSSRPRSALRVSTISGNFFTIVS